MLQQANLNAVFWILMFGCALTFSFLVKNHSLARVILLLLFSFNSLSIAYFLNYEKLFPLIIAAPFIVFFFYILLSSLYGLDVTNMFPRNVQNSVSMVGLFGASLIYLAYLPSHTNTQLRPPLWPAFMAFLIALLATGRSGITSTGLLLLGAIVMRVKNSKHKKTQFFVTLSVIIIIFALFLVFFGNIALKITARFAVKHSEDPRIEISHHYLQQLKTPRHFIFGYDVAEDWYMGRWAGNLHNSLLYFHSLIGASSLAFLCFIFYGIVMRGWKCPLLWFLGLAYLFRISTDNGALMGIMDIVLFYFLFDGKSMSMNSEKKHQHKFKKRESPLLEVKRCSPSSTTL